MRDNKHTYFENNYENVAVRVEYIGCQCQM